jgi:hypothetical protein
MTATDDLNLSCLVHAYAEVVLPAVAAGEVPFGNCLVMSPAGAQVLRRLGTDAEATAVHVTFLDLEADTVVSTDPAQWDVPGSEVMPGVDPRHLGNGHAVILTPTKLVDLTFGQFDVRGIVSRLLVINLSAGWRGELAWGSPDGRWAVRFEQMTSDEVLRRNEAALASTNPGLVDLLVEEALVHRRRLVGPVGRNDPCPCGSGRKSKFCPH